MPPKFVSSGSINVNDLTQEKEQVRKLNERYLYNRNKNERRSLINQLYENRIKKNYENKKKWENQNSAYRLNYKDSIYYNQLNKDKYDEIINERLKDKREIENFHKLKEGNKEEVNEEVDEVDEVEQPIIIKKRKIKGIIKKQKVETEVIDKKDRDQSKDEDEDENKDKLKLLDGYSSEDE